MTTTFRWNLLRTEHLTMIVGTHICAFVFASLATAAAAQTPGTIPVFAGGSSLTNSLINQSPTGVGVGGTLSVFGTIGTNSEVQSIGSGAGFRVLGGTGDSTNGAPWYGLGASNLNLVGASQPAVQVAGFFGLNYRVVVQDRLNGPIDSQWLSGRGRANPHVPPCCHDHLAKTSLKVAGKNLVGITSLGPWGGTGAWNWALRGVYQYWNGVSYNADGGDPDIIKALAGNTILATKTDGSPLGNIGIRTTSPTAA